MIEQNQFIAMSANSEASHPIKESKLVKPVETCFESMTHFDIMPGTDSLKNNFELNLFYAGI